jgi:hypothetical protein
MRTPKMNCNSNSNINKVNIYSLSFHLLLSWWMEFLSPSDTSKIRQSPFYRLLDRYKRCCRQTYVYGRGGHRIVWRSLSPLLTHFHNQIPSTLFFILSDTESTSYFVLLYSKSRTRLLVVVSFKCQWLSPGTYSFIFYCAYLYLCCFIPPY